MNASERIVEAYFRFVKGIYTLTNVKGHGQVEIDLIGVDPRKDKPVFYHVETSVSISAHIRR